MNNESIKDLLYRLGDDELIMGHRNSEWTGLGPILEEDIAFSSMSQDEIGHAQAYYYLLQEHFGGPDPDVTGFQRKPEEFRCCQLVEYPIGDYAFSLVRHFLYDAAEHIRLQELTQSGFAPLAELARKLIREEKYHLLHARTWMAQLSQGSEEAKSRLQKALNDAMPLAYGIFEPGAFDAQLEKDGVMPAESKLEKMWLDEVSAFLKSCGLNLPEVKDKSVAYGGRKGQHSAYLAPLMKEMTEVSALDPAATW